MTDSRVRAEAYAFIAIHRFLEETCFAAYPNVPEKTGGMAYRYFSPVLDEIDNMIGPGVDGLDLPESVAENIRNKAFSSLQDYIETNSLAYDTGGLSATDRSDYSHFKGHWENVQRLLNGASPQQLITLIEDEVREVHTPPKPSWP